MEAALAELQQDETKAVRIIITRYIGGAIAYDLQRFYREIDGWRSLANASTLADLMAGQRVHRKRETK